MRNYRAGTADSGANSNENQLSAANRRAGLQKYSQRRIAESTKIEGEQKEEYTLICRQTAKEERFEPRNHTYIRC